MAVKNTFERVMIMCDAAGACMPDEYIQMLADDAEAVILHYRHTDTIEDEYLPLAARIAQYWLEKTGYSGAIAISENGISRNYETGDVPNSLLRQITPAAVALEI